jgi:hypothetical protein
VVAKAGLERGKKQLIKISFAPFLPSNVRRKGSIVAPIAWRQRDEFKFTDGYMRDIHVIRRCWYDSCLQIITLSIILRKLRTSAFLPAQESP